ncbi:MAG: hypothetical protein AAGH46_13790 [Bacteroidota bacterium]
MDIANAEIEASRAWRNKKTNEYSVDTDKCQGPGRASEKIGCQSFPVNRDDWSWRDFIGLCRQANAGGILDRLIQSTIEQIKESEERTVDLKKQLTELEQISRELFEGKTG